MRRDSTVRVPIPGHADSLIRRDSAGATRVVPPAAPTDTVQPPLAQAPIPTLLPSDRALHFTREQLFATGAITLQDLLSRVGIVTVISAGYISAPSLSAIGGDFRRTRLFIDGIEYDALDARANGIFDASQVQLWMLQDVTIERSAVEVRVHLRTWTVDRTSPYTRTDIATGDQQVNLYRGFFGRRFGGGQAVQFAAQQYSTSPPRDLGSSADQLGILGRFGWAGTTYSLDGSFIRVGRHRGDIRAFGRIDSIAGLESTRLTAYVRAGFRDPDTSATWAQAVLSTTSYDFKPVTAVTTTTTTASDSIKRDTSTSQRQYYVAAGANRGPLRIVASARLRQRDSTTLITPAVTASFSPGAFTVRATVEGQSPDSLNRADVAGEYLLGNTLRFGAAIDRTRDHRKAADGLTSTGSRVWAGFRAGSVWMDVGMIRRDSALLVAPTAIGTPDTTARVLASLAPKASGLTLRATGRVWHALYVDLNAIRWSDTAAIYRPRYQTRSELFVQTNLLRRFPKNNFGLLVSGRHEYRSASLIPAADTVLRAQGERSISTLLEIRIASAVVSWQLRNIVGTRNFQADGYLLPRTVNFYGVRWEFWN